MHRAIALAVLVACVPTASAQRIGGQRFVPATSEDGIFDTEGADRRAILFPYVALWAHYALDPVLLVDGAGRRFAIPVAHAFAADLVASMAVWEGLEFGFVLPVEIFNTGDAAAAQAAGMPAAPGTVLGDVQLRVAYRFRLAEHTALAFHVPVLLPTNPDDDILALGLGVRPTVAFMQRIGPLELVLNAYVLVRESVRLIDYRGGSELGSRLGLRIDLSGRWQTALLAEAGFSSAFEGFFHPASTPAEARMGLEHWFDAHWRISFFAGSGIGPGVGSPDFRTGISLAFGDNVPYRPRPSATDGDRDGDGVRDSRDACPNRAEDPDGFQDGDGCPEADNDRDGLLDYEDQCPDEPETRNGVDDADGCSDRVRIRGSRIETFDAVHFRTGSDEILEDSHPMLREVAQVMRVNERMRVRIEGHTDNEGPDDQNLELSRRRAQSVRRYLMSRGVQGSRLRAVGYGETRPIASNATEAGRRRNRRVEFHIEGGRR